MQQKGLIPKAKKDAIASKIKLKEKVEITSFKDFSMGYAVPPNQKKAKTNDGKKTSRVSNNKKKMTKANTKKTSLKSLYLIIETFSNEISIFENFTKICSYIKIINQ